MIFRIIIAIFLSAIAFVLWAVMSPTATIQPLISDSSLETTQRHIVTRVLDGDTIVIAGGEKVRYIGIDSPELYGNSAETECFAQEAKSRNEQLLLGKPVRLERDISETDQYGRLLRYVFIDDPLSSIHPNTSINEILVHEGFAAARAYPPDTKLKDTLSELQEDAQQHKRGLWGSCLD